MTDQELQPLIDWIRSQGAPAPVRVRETHFSPGGNYSTDSLRFISASGSALVDTGGFAKNPTVSLIDLIHAGVVQRDVKGVVPYFPPSEVPVAPPNPTGDTRGRIGAERMQRSGVGYSPRRFDKIGFAPIGEIYTTSTGGVYISCPGENPFSPEYWLESKRPGS